MRNYAKIAPTFWTGQTGKALKKEGAETQLLALYLLSSPHANMLGLYYLPIPFICHETGLTFEGASEALQRLSEAGFAHYDHDSEHVWVVEMARYQVGEYLAPNDKRVRGVQSEYDSLPKCLFLGAFFDKYAEAFHLESRRPSEAPSKALRSQEQEQEQEQEQDIPPTQDPNLGKEVDSSGEGGARVHSLPAKGQTSEAPARRKPPSTAAQAAERVDNDEEGPW